MSTARTPDGPWVKDGKGLRLPAWIEQAPPMHPLWPIWHFWAMVGKAELDKRGEGE